MALAKNHQACIEAELDREIQRELDARSQQRYTKVAKNEATAESSQHQLSEQRYSEQQYLFLQRSEIILTKMRHVLVSVAITIQHRPAIIFNRLVKKGRRLSAKIKKTKIKRQALEQAVNMARAESKPKPAAKLTAVDKIHHLEHSIENSLDRGRNNTLHWIGVPSQVDFDELVNRVELLSEKVEFLEQELQQSGWTQDRVNHTVIG